MNHEFNNQYNVAILDEKNKFAPYLASALIAASPLSMDANAEPAHNKPSISKYDSNTSQYSKQEQHNILARTLWAEARNDGQTGMEAVATVIYNRGYGDPDKMINAIKARKQFSCWNGMNRSDWSNFKMKKKSGSEWKIAENIASSVLEGRFQPIASYDHYFNAQKARPYWGYVDKERTKLKPHVKVGSHLFMKLGQWVTR